jgi:hypothetical protein
VEHDIVLSEKDNKTENNKIIGELIPFSRNRSGLKSKLTNAFPGGKRDSNKSKR